MSGFTSFDLFETSIWRPRATLSLFPPPIAMDEFEVGHLGFAFDLLNPNPSPSPFDLFERLQERAETEYHISSLSDRVTALELGFGRALAPRISDLDRKYKWIAEIKGERVDQKYKWTAEAKAGEEKSYTWRADIKGKGKGREEKTYTFEASASPPNQGKGKSVIKEKEEKKEQKEKKKESGVKLVEIEETNPGAIRIRKVCARNSSTSFYFLM